MNSKFKIQNLRIWKLIENCPASAGSRSWREKLEIGNSLQGGYVAISIMLILTAVILGIIVTVAQLGIGEGQASLALTKGEDTLNFVEGCTEDALLKIRSNAAYTEGTITRPEGTCSVNIITVGSTYTVTVTTTATQYRRTIQAIVNRSSSAVILTSWKEQ
jgi:hypothetical protein